MSETTSVPETKSMKPKVGYGLPKWEVLDPDGLRPVLRCEVLHTAADGAITTYYARVQLIKVNRVERSQSR